VLDSASFIGFGLYFEKTDSRVGIIPQPYFHPVKLPTMVAEVYLPVFGVEIPGVITARPLFGNSKHKVRIHQFFEYSAQPAGMKDVLFINPVEQLHGVHFGK